MKIKEKLSKMTEASKASLFFAISSFLIKGISLVTTPIFTRIMETDQYGVVSTYNAWSLIIEVLAVIGLTSSGVINVGLNDYSEKRNEYLANVTIISNFFTVIIFGLLFVVNSFVYSILPTSLVIVMFIHFMFYPAQIFWITKQRYEYMYVWVVILTVVEVIVGQGIAILAVRIFTENQAFARICSNEIGYLLVSIPLYIIVLKNGHYHVDIEITSQILSFAIPLIPHYLSQHIMSGADKIMLGNMISSSEAAIYALAYNVGWIITILWNAVNSSFVPFIYKCLNNNDFAKTKRVSGYLVTSYAALCLTVSFFAPEITRLLAPSEYYRGVMAVPPIVAVSFLVALYNLYANIEFYFKKKYYITLSTIVATGVNLILNYLLIPKFGLIGAAYTTLISYVVLIFMHYIGYRRCLKEKVYADKFIMIETIVLIVLIVFTGYIYENNYIRLGIFICLVLFGFVFKKWLKKFINGIIKEIVVNDK